MTDADLTPTEIARRITKILTNAEIDAGLRFAGGGGSGKSGYTAYYNRALTEVQISPPQDSYYLLCTNCQRMEK